MINEGLNLRGEVALVLKDKDGNIKEQREEKNLVVSTGLNFITSRMKDATATAMTHMAVGSDNTAPVAGDADLGSILGSREALDSTTVTDNTITYVSSFEAGEGTGSIVEAGIFNASTAGTMLCRVVFGTITKAADDTLQITWTITLTAS